MTRYLIVNADDFGRSPGVNRGIITAHEQGIVTSASLMVRWPAAVAAAAYGRMHPHLSLGLHLDLSEWEYRDDNWLPVYQVVSLEDAEAVAREVSQQLTLFRRLVGRDPTHLDSHQHVHRSDPVHTAVRELAERLGVPLRAENPMVRYCGEFYGQTGKGYPLPEYIRVESLIQILHDLPPGITELGCHPGEADDLNSVYARERRIEVQTLCAPQVRAAIAAEGIQLCSFRNVPALLQK